MTFENIIGKISQILSIIVIFLLVDGFYLSQKGFVWEDGDVVLSSQADTNDAIPAIKDTSIVTDFSVPEYNVLGSVDAPVTLYEFSSFGCGHCADFHLNMLPELKKEYIDTGMVKLVYVAFPIGEKSMKLSMLSKCIPDDKYFDFLNLVYEKQRVWSFSLNSEKLFVEYAKQEGVNEEKAIECMSNDSIYQEILHIQEQSASKLNVQGTPSFLIKSNGSDSEEFMSGLPSYEVFKQKLDKHL